MYSSSAIMKTQFGFSVGFFLVLLVFYCTSVLSKVEESENTVLDSKTLVNGNIANKKNTGSDKVFNSGTVGSEKKDDDQVSGLREGVQSGGDKIKKDSNGESGPKKVNNAAGFGDKGKEGDKGNGQTGDKSISKDVPKDVEKDSNVVSSDSKRKDGSWAEDCGSSNKCTDEENKLVACLRVPGNESPHLSLLIQNKGKGPLKVKISAPDFVNLENREIQLHEKEDKKVKVSIGDGGGGSKIVLTAGSGHCSLDFRDLIAHNTVNESEDFPKPSRIGYLLKAPIIAILAFAIILTIASASLCISIRRKHFTSTTSKYQRLDMELPVSIGGKSVADNNDGWDNNWDDDWDDEAPHTPSMPVTPGLSSKGLASRRLNKDAWKD